MKNLFVILFLFTTVISFSQVIDYNEKDDFTGAIKIKTKMAEGKYIKDSDKITTEHSVYTCVSYFKLKDNTEVYLINFGVHLLGMDGGCLSEYTGKAILLFEDGTKMELKQQSDTDCSSDMQAASYFLASEDQADVFNSAMLENAKILAEKPVKKFRIYWSDGYVDFDMKPDKKDIWIKHFALINSNL